MKDMKITIIGRGNVGSHLYKAFTESGVDCSLMDSRSFNAEFGEMHSALYIICVKDDVIGEVAARLKSKLGDKAKNAIVVHTAGTKPMSILEEHFDNHGVFYPMQTFSKGKRVEWRSVPLFLEAASAGDMIQLRGMASSISDNVSELDSEKRAEMHLAAVFVSNFSNRMYAIAESLLAECGIPFSVMYPLIEETASKATEISPHDAQTGPAIRGDWRVTDMHSALLSSHPEWRELYEKISEDIRRSYS